MIRIELERVEALELLGMTLAHLSDAEARGEVSPRVPLLMGSGTSSPSPSRRSNELHRGPGDRCTVRDEQVPR